MKSHNLCVCVYVSLYLESSKDQTTKSQLQEDSALSETTEGEGCPTPQSRRPSPWIHLCRAAVPLGCQLRPRWPPGGRWFSPDAQVRARWSSPSLSSLLSQMDVKCSTELSTAWPIMCAAIWSPGWKSLLLSFHLPPELFILLSEGTDTFYVTLFHALPPPPQVPHGPCERNDPNTSVWISS